jgi:hypothetical protein
MDKLFDINTYVGEQKKGGKKKNNISTNSCF